MVKVTYSTLPFLKVNPVKAAELCLKHGALKVEIFMDGAHFNGLSDKELYALAKELKKLPLEYSVHPPIFDLNLTSENAAIRQATVAEFKKAIRFAGEIKASHVVIDPGIRQLEIFDLKKAVGRSKEAIQELILLAEEFLVKLGIENIGYLGKELFTKKEYISFIEEFDHSLVGYLLDTGHAHLTKWNQPELFKEIEKNLIAVHVNDTKGNKDNHLPIGEGNIQWDDIFQVLKKYKNYPDFVLEYNTVTQVEKMQDGKEIIEKYLD